MSAIALESLRYKQATLYSNDGKKKIDISNSIVSFQYYEDFMSPCITAVVKIVNTSGIYNNLPIRCGEKLELEIVGLHQTLSFTGDKAWYVCAVNNLTQNEKTENFDLSLVMKDMLSNETTRVQKKYDNKVTIDQHVTKILTDVLGVPKKRLSIIERTANAYGFYGNLKKPYYICTWLGPKSIPLTSGAGGTSGKGKEGKAKGTSGFLFYETYDGYNFRSIENLVNGSNTEMKTDEGKSKQIQTFSYTGVIEGDNNSLNVNKITFHYMARNNDLFASLRMGKYANRTYFFDPYYQDLDVFNYTLKDEIKSLNTLSKRKDLLVPDFFLETPSRIMSRTSDRGMFTDTLSETSGRDNADMAKSISRYNLLFSQTLNINIPLNLSLRVGETVKIILPKANNNTQENVPIDEEMSGLYVISALRHSCIPKENQTALNLIRDSYGLYKS